MRKIRAILFATVMCCSVVLLYGAAEKIKEHLVPARKKLSKKDVQRLYERGERVVYRGKELKTIGMPVGGIATGQLYLHGDGTLGLWQIFNKHIFTGYGANCYIPYSPAAPVDSGFAVVVKRGSKTMAKLLNGGFGNVEFAGEYPIGIVRYSDKNFPVKIEMEAFSPFIPLNAKDSALPATIFHFTVENTSESEVQAFILGWLENAVCFHSVKSVHTRPGSIRLTRSSAATTMPVRWRAGASIRHFRAMSTTGRGAIWALRRE